MVLHLIGNTTGATGTSSTTGVTGATAFYSLASRQWYVLDLPFFIPRFVCIACPWGQLDDSTRDWCGVFVKYPGATWVEGYFWLVWCGWVEGYFWLVWVGSFDFNRTLNRYGRPVSGFLYCPGSVSDSANTSLWLLSIDCVLRISSLSSVRMLAPSFLGFVPSGLGSVVFGNPGLVHIMLSLFYVQTLCMWFLVFLLSLTF